MLPEQASGLDNYIVALARHPATGPATTSPPWRGTRQQARQLHHRLGTASRNSTGNIQHHVHHRAHPEHKKARQAGLRHRCAHLLVATELPESQDYYAYFQLQQHFYYSPTGIFQNLQPQIQTLSVHAQRGQKYFGTTARFY